MYTVIIEIITGESSEDVLKCEVYGYPCNSSPPVGILRSDELHNGRYTTTVNNAGLLSGNSMSTTRFSMLLQMIQGTIHAPGRETVQQSLLELQ